MFERGTQRALKSSIGVAYGLRYRRIFKISRAAAAARAASETESRAAAHSHPDFAAQTPEARADGVYFLK